MVNENQSPEVKTKNITVSLVFSWIFGVIVGLVGIGTLFSNVLVGLLFIIAAVIVLPPTYALIKNKFKISLSRGLKIIIVVIIFAIAGTITSQGNTPATNSTPTVQTPAEPIAKVTADKLMSDYNANEVSADAKYKGNLI